MLLQLHNFALQKKKRNRKKRRSSVTDLRLHKAAEERTVAPLSIFCTAETERQRNRKTEKSLLQRNERWRLLAAAVSCIQYFALQKQRDREEFSDWSQPSATQGCCRAADGAAATTFCTAVSSKGSAMLYKLHQTVSDIIDLQLQ